MVKEGRGGGGQTKVWGSFNTGACSCSHAEGGRKKVPPCGRVGRCDKCYPALRGGGAGGRKKFRRNRNYNPQLNYRSCIIM